MLPLNEKKKIAVVGGGIAGMEVARVAALRGHEVDLYEKTNKLGGVFVAASAFSFKEDDRKLLSWYELQMKKTGVNVHLGTEVTMELLNSVKPDAIVVATGATPIIPRITGIENSKVVTATEFLLGNKDAGNNVVIIGGGLTGCEIAYEQAKKGKHVTIVEMLDSLMADPNIPSITVKGLNIRLKQNAVNIMTGSSAKEVSDNDVTVEKDGQLTTIPSDTVITAVGYRSNTALYDSLKDYGGEVYLLGDASKVSNLMNAIWNGYEIGRTI